MENRRQTSLQIYRPIAATRPIGELLSERKKVLADLIESETDLDGPARAIESRREDEIADMSRRLNSLSRVMTKAQRQKVLASMGVDEDFLVENAIATAKQVVAEERDKLSRSLVVSQNAIQSAGKVSYAEVSELYKLVIAIKNKILVEAETDGRLIFEEGITVKDLASFTLSVNNLYSTYMRSREMSKLYDDINKITEAIKQAMKIMPREAVEKFTEVLSSFEND